MPVYDDKHIKTILWTYGDKVYTIFRGLILMIITNIKLGDNDDELEIIIHVRLVAWCNEYKQCKRKN